MNKSTIALSYYLPQYHTIPENDEWWGTGYTEWEALRTAKPLFRGQIFRKPIPTLGEYSLLSPKTMAQQASLATSHGINGFAVWDYWFGNGKQLLERPMKIAQESGIKFPFCFFWANHSWYDKGRNRLLIRQEYPGAEDYKRYIEKCLPFFSSPNYLKVDGAPILGIFKPSDIPDLECWVTTVRAEAVRAGYPGLFLIAESTDPTDSWAKFFDRTLNSSRIYAKRRLDAPMMYVREQLLKRWKIAIAGPLKYDYTCLAKGGSISNAPGIDHRQASVVMCGWDTTPRHASRATYFANMTEAKFRSAAYHAFKELEAQMTPKVLIVKSWNEWAEGNLIEPDSVFGCSLLEIFASERHKAEASESTH